MSTPTHTVGSCVCFVYKQLTREALASRAACRGLWCDFRQLQGSEGVGLFCPTVLLPDDRDALDRRRGVAGEPRPGSPGVGMVSPVLGAEWPVSTSSLLCLRSSQKPGLKHPGPASSHCILPVNSPAGGASVSSLGMEKRGKLSGSRRSSTRGRKGRVLEAVPLPSG